LTEQVIAKFKIETPEAMHELGLELAKRFSAGDLVLLTGLLGAGKTTLTRGIGEGLRVIGNVSSPTFVIARTHRTENSNLDLVHVDAYRLSSSAEFDDLEIDYSRSVVLVEWGRGFTDGITDSWLDIEIQRSHDPASDLREVTITAFGDKYDGWQL
jgi:tRNA threonylcarbamoyladenosine biosynthesis protein TsaE